MVASKRDAIAAIIEMNPTANPVFLSEFSKSDLEHYLDRLGRAIETEDESDRSRHGRVTDTEESARQELTSDDRWW
jgi:hypothetical protein